MFGPRLFIWPCILFYLSVLATPITSTLQILILGLIHDSVFNMPLGLSSFTWILCYGFLAKQRRYLIKAPMHILWIAFAGTFSVLTMIDYIILKRTHHAIDAIRLILETILSIGIFPFGIHFFHALLLRLGRFR